MKLEADPSPTSKPKKPRKVNETQLLITRLVTNMKGCYNPAIWGREGRLAKKLIEIYGKEFMAWMPAPEGYQVASLMWFYSDLGKNYISDQMFEYKKQFSNVLQKEETEIQLSNTKIGEDVEIKLKPKTLKDYLNYGKK